MTIQSAPDTARAGRPVPITILCVLCAIGVVFAVPLIFSDAARSIGAWYPPSLALASLVGAACTVGFWLMRRWALYLYFALFLINQIVLLVTGLWSIMALILPAIVIAIGLAYHSRLR